MDNRFVLNEAFEKNAKVYQTRPVKAMKYQRGMENGWILHFSSIKEMGTIYEGVKFFDTKTDAIYYMETNRTQNVSLNGNLEEHEIEYNIISPVLYRKKTEGERRLGVDLLLGDYDFAFISDESRQYDYIILDEKSWIIQDADGNVRVWSIELWDSCGDTFFGNPKDFVHEKMENEYIKVQM